MPRPGTDGALACAVMHVLFAEGYADRDYLARYTDAPEELEQHLQTRTPQWAAQITGLTADEIIGFAHLYGKTKRSFIRLGYGFSRSRNGAVNMHAVSCLPAVTGAWQYPGGGALYSNMALYHIDWTLIMGLDARDENIRVLDQARIGPILCGDKRDLADGPPVKALFIQNTNPVVVAPESLQVRSGFARDDLFICVHEQFMTETAAMADIVLPATTFLEHDDLYLAGGHTFLQVTRKVIEPYAESRSNHWVIGELARRLGAGHPGFAMSEWELIDATLQRSGHPDAETIYRQHWLDCTQDFATMHFLNGFAHPDRRFRFKPDWSSIGPLYEYLPALPDYCDRIDQASAAKPFRLIAAPARAFLNSSFTETPSSRKVEGRPTLQIHPDDCQQLGITEGCAVRLGNERGSVVVHARPFAHIPRGVVVVESIWNNASFVEGNGINTLTTAEPGFPNGGATFHDTAIWIEAA
jgi:anaerobic selenocysteine-containing dehydrogenase